MPPLEERTATVCTYLTFMKHINMFSLVYHYIQHCKMIMYCFQLKLQLIYTCYLLSCFCLYLIDFYVFFVLIFEYCFFPAVNKL